MLLHSDTDLQQGYNFLEDVSDAEHAQAVMKAEIADSIGSEYRGTPVRLHLKPIQNSDWYVVTMAPKSLVNLPVSNMVFIALTASMGLMLCGLLLMGLMVFVASLGRKEPRRASLDVEPLFRPSADQEQRYGMLGALVFCGAVLLCTMALLTPWVPLWVLLPAQVAVGGLALKWIRRTAGNEAVSSKGPAPEANGRIARALAMLRNWDREHSDSGRFARQNSLAFCYALWWFSLVGIFLIAPASLFFAGAYDLIVENEVRADQVHVAQALRERPDCLARLSSLPREPREACPKLVVDERPTRLQKTPNGVTIAAASILPPTDWSRSLAETAIGAQRWLAQNGLFPIHWMLDWLPPMGLREDDNSLQYRDDQARRSTWDRKIGAIEASVEDESNVVRMTSLLPSLHQTTGQVRERSFLVATVLIFLVIAFAVLYVSLRRLFFLDLITLMQRELAPSKRRSIVQRVDAFLDATTQDVAVFVHTLTPNQVQALLDHYTKAASPLTLVDFDERVRSKAEPMPLPSGKVLLYSQRSDPISQLEEKQRDEWAKVLRRCRFVVPPPSADEYVEHDQYLTAYLRTSWSNLSADEKKVLAQLATTGFATPHAEVGTSLEQLTRRGLVRADTLTITDSNITDFVRAEISSGRYRPQTAAADGNAWDQLKAPLLAVVGVACAALGVSEPELVATGVLAPALAAGMPAAIRALGRAVAR